MIPAAEEAELSRKSVALEQATTDQLAVVTVTSLHGQDAATFSRNLGNRLGVGQAKTNNGVLLLVAPNEKQVRIAVGDGLSTLLTDQRAAKIVADMVPLFRSGEGARAIRAGVDEVEAVLRSDARRPQFLKKAA